MGKSVTVESHIDIPRNLRKVDNDAFWTFAANEWWRLYFPYIPFDTGTLARSVRISPKTIEHFAPYANSVYNGKFRNFRKDKHPLASAFWDAAAIPSQRDKLIGSMQEYVDSGRCNLDG
ncbi:MAG TPA: minor capsid protein [Clostridiales bacterium]|nr:minor capsid protein [Clostridiales bacterium]